MTLAATPPPFGDAAMLSLPFAINVNLLPFCDLHCRKHNFLQMNVFKGIVEEDQEIATM
jgi:hypothetical protein